jgi:hypothetical protein
MDFKLATPFLEAFEELTNQYPELYDYYIKFLEDNPERIKK